MSLVQWLQEDVTVNHFAAKIVENVATTTTPHAQVCRIR